MPDKDTAAPEDGQIENRQIADRQSEDRRGQVAVIFAAWRSGVDQAGYAASAAAMDALAARQPGFRGVDAARGEGGFGITVSYWADEASATAWRAHPDHTAAREPGRGRWYARYDLHVAHVTRNYGWSREGRGE